MNVKSLKKAIGSVLRNKRPRKALELPMTSAIAATTKCCMRPTFHMPPACDIEVFALLDLPTELVEAIISEMVVVVGFYRAVRLRFVNKLFDEATTNIMFSQRNACFLPLELYYPMQQTGRVAFARILERKIANESSVRSPLHRTINGCIDLLERLPSQNSSDIAHQRKVYLGILCACTINVMSMRTAIRSLSAEDETPVEVPSIGALIAASALGDITLIEALIAQGSCVEDESSLFGSSIDAAARYGHIDAVKVLMKYSQSKPHDIFSAIRGGNRDIVQLFLDKFYKSAPYISDDYSQYAWRVMPHMVISAAAEDQTTLLYMLINYFPTTYRSIVLERALYHAVLFSAKSTVKSLLDAKVKISGFEEPFGSGLYVVSKRGDLETVRLLVESGSTDRYLLPSFENCMHVAAAKGHIKVVQFFIDYGVDVNCRFHCPKAPLGMNEEFWGEIDPNDPATTNAARNGDFHMFRFLVRRGGRVDLENEFGPIQKRWLEQIQAWEEEFSAK